MLENLKSVVLPSLPVICSKGKKSTRDQKRDVCSSKIKSLEIQKLVAELMVSKKVSKMQ